MRLINEQNQQAMTNQDIFLKFKTGILGDRHDICHKHHKQRLCRIINSRVKFQFVDVHVEHFMYVYFCFLVIFSHLNE